MSVNYFNMNIFIDKILQDNFSFFAKMPDAAINDVHYKNTNTLFKTYFQNQEIYVKYDA